jgi:hypothetical protein
VAAGQFAAELAHHLLQFALGFVLLVDQLDLPLLFTFLEQKVGVSNNLIRLLHDLVNIRCLAKKFGIVLLVVLHSLLLEELFAHVSPRVQLLGSQLHIDKVGFFQNFVHFVHFMNQGIIWHF